MRKVEIIEGKKACPSCEESLSTSGFSVNRKTASGLCSWCKTCTKKSRKDKDTRKHYWNNIEKYKLSSRKCALKKEYNITLEDYENMLKNQNHKCKICGVHQKTLSINLSVDHCHETGKVRGLLCNLCNPGIGYFKNSIKNLKEAINYLESTT